jgi:hypothetical protein
MISSNPYHPLRLQRELLTHGWGGSWMVDGETSVMMMVMISSKSPSRQGTRTEFLVLNRGFWWWRRSGTLSGKNAKPFRVFVMETLYRRRGEVRGQPGPTHHRVACPRGHPRHQVLWWPPGPPPALFRTSSRIGKNRRFELHFVQF